MEQEEAPRGSIVLEIRRGFWRRRPSVPPGSWAVESRPVLGPELLALHHAALKLMEAGKVDDAVSQWRVAALRLAKGDRPVAAAWCRLRAAVVLAQARRGEEAREELRAGGTLITPPSLRAVFWERAGNALLQSGRRAAAGRAFARALELHSAVDDRSPALAFTLLQLCRTAHRLHGAKAKKAVAIYRALQGEGMQTARALHGLASCRYARSRYDLAEASSRKALAIVDELGPESPLLTGVLGLLGRTVLHQGDFKQARKLFRRELEAAERLAPGGPPMGYAYNHLGLVAKLLGQYQEARSSYLDGLAIYRACRPGGIEVAGTLNNLGNVAMKEDDLSTSLLYHREALAIRKRLHPGGADVAASLNNIGVVERQMDRLDAAREHLEMALELKRTITPGSLTLSNTLAELGMVATAQRLLSEAERLYAEAREIRERIVPGSPQVADIVFLQGELARRAGHGPEAERLWKESLAIAERRGETLELSQDERSRFGARFYLFYGSLARLLVEENREEEAFNLMERARARALRAMLVGAGSIPAGVPGSLWISYCGIIRKIDSARANLARRAAAPGVPDESQTALELRNLEDRRDRLARKLRAAAPRLSVLGATTSPTLAEVRRALDPGTVLLSYVVGKEQTLLFVTGAAGSGIPLRTVVIPAGFEELKRRIDILCAFIARGRTVDTVDPALITQARRLWGLLLAPAMEAIAPARLVLIVPDGPLRDAPFAVLVLPGEPVRFFGQWKPVFFDPSAGVFMALKARRHATQRGTRMVAFGDPDYPEDSEAVRALHLRPLDGSRSEVRWIAARFGDEARLYLGRDATEQRLRSLRGTARYLHLAVHARADGRFPLESSLFLSMPVASGDPPSRDGVLHAWEIMDAFHLDADVVTLSGCSTARGEPVGGEGVLGLARAFQVAGADTVVAARWPIPDRSTSVLMDRFYAGLVGGLNTAMALQNARKELLAGPIDPPEGTTLDARHPFHWAAFKVMGDWR